MSAIDIAKQLGVKQNVCIRVIDEVTGKVVQQHMGHNTATNTLITGIGHYLIGEGSLGQGQILSSWLPQYISVGTMGLINQEEDEFGLPAGIGVIPGTEVDRFVAYMQQCPGFGSDGYDDSLINGRPYQGLGPMFPNRPSPETVNCELITEGFRRSMISFRDVVPEYEAEYPRTIDVVFSAYVSTGALAEFREEGKNYVFITEAGLWSRPDWISSGQNGLLAGYRICPPDSNDWDMTIERNRELLKRNIIKVKVNQVVQIIWKIQLGGLSQLGGFINEDEQWVDKK